MICIYNYAKVKVKVYSNFASTLFPMLNLKISADVLYKLEHKHGVIGDEIEQCFGNRTGQLLEDTREKHKTNPPTLWFLACTNKLRLPKILYIQIGDRVELKSAFSPNKTEIDIYSRHG